MYAGDTSNPLTQPRIVLHIVSLRKWGLLTYVEDPPVTTYKEGVEFNPKTKDGKPQGFITFKVEKVKVFTFPFPQTVVLSSPVGDVHRLALESPIFGWERSERKHYREVIKAFKKND